MTPMLSFCLNGSDEFKAQPPDDALDVGTLKVSDWGRDFTLFFTDPDTAIKLANALFGLAREWQRRQLPSNEAAAAHAAMMPDPALDFAADAMHGPKDEADPLGPVPGCIHGIAWGSPCGSCELNAPPDAAPMSAEEQEKALAHLDAAFDAEKAREQAQDSAHTAWEITEAHFEADRQKVISEVMGMVGGSDVAEEWKAMAGEPFDLPPSVGGAAVEATRKRLAAIDATASPGPCPICGQPNTPVHQEYEAAMLSAASAVADL